ncbi:MAG TPA: acetyl-CoA hydrolase/transferase C-terminal domain-containing protein [Spirochaetota bacterium]|nr:acetyl-CoA hydrolase/transferase C-terminal domain-containing protein [Spirochaetota bacterium]HPJ34852.1 acetyl-CoA hydrolase/transferase C-terminal domain-containing protein [Spirochaetota bacterium]
MSELALIKKRGKENYSTWKEEYQAKLTTAEEAAKVVQSGESVFFGGGTGIPTAFATALGKRAHELTGITISQGYAMGLFDYMKPENKERFQIETMFVGPMERICMEWGVAQLKPMHLSEIPAAAVHAQCKRVAFVASPPDENGYMNRSCFGSFLPNEECVRPAETIIVEVNKNAPRLNSDDFKIHVSDVDMIIENDFPMFELPEIPIMDEEKLIAQYIADLIPDGSCIQIGLGGLANAVGYLLHEKNDLGMHAEVVSPSVAELVKMGVLNGAKKNFMPGKVVSAFAVGTKKFYEEITDNENFYFKEVGWVNNPDIIAQNDNLVSINNTLMMDLTGQAASESIGIKQYSATGGQLDFILGARKSKNGKSILALNSTYTDKEGKLQTKIMPTLPVGTVVTTPRTLVQYVITEYGVANLRLRTVKERVQALIGIAHPDFRDQLTFEAKKNGWL